MKTYTRPVVTYICMCYYDRVKNLQGESFADFFIFPVGFS